jgi:hypothetical protein
MLSFNVANEMNGLDVVILPTVPVSPDLMHESHQRRPLDLEYGA